jgi:hypothetical protein
MLVGPCRNFDVKVSFFFGKAWSAPWNPFALVVPCRVYGFETGIVKFLSAKVQGKYVLLFVG